MRGILAGGAGRIDGAAVIAAMHGRGGRDAWPVSGPRKRKEFGHDLSNPGVQKSCTNQPAPFYATIKPPAQPTRPRTGRGGSTTQRPGTFTKDGKKSQK